MANFEKSTQYHKWTFTKEELVRKRDDSALYAMIRLYLFEELMGFAARLSLRQRVLSTAQVYLSRVLTRIEITEMNPYLLMAACVYIASRAEEQPVHIRTVSMEGRLMWPTFMPVEAWQLAECEFYVLAEIETCLVVHHPYDPLVILAKRLKLVSAELQACWAVINDTYATDIPLIFTPSVIAYTAIYMVLVLKPGLIPNRPAKQVKLRLDTLSAVLSADATLDLRALMACVQELLSLYALKSDFDRGAIAEELKKRL